MLAIDFSIYHHGCPACQSTERFPDLEMKILSSVTYGGNKASVLQYVDSDRSGEVKRFLEYWREHEAVMGLEVSDRSDSAALFNVSLESDGGWVTEAVQRNNGVFTGPVSVRGGFEDWRVLVSESDKSSMLADLESVGVIKVDRMKRVDLGEILVGFQGYENVLSSRQLQVLRMAFADGYFESPRRVSSRELAMRVGIAQSTLLEHLRKAQFKIISKVFETRRRSF